jgi:hypothetical protein
VNVEELLIKTQPELGTDTYALKSNRQTKKISFADTERNQDGKKEE